MYLLRKAIADVGETDDMVTAEAEKHIVSDDGLFSYIVKVMEFYDADIKAVANELEHGLVHDLRSMMDAYDVDEIDWVSLAESLISQFA